MDASNDDDVVPNRGTAAGHFLQQVPDMPEPSSRPRNRWLSDGIAISHRIMIACLGLVIPIGLGWWAGDRWNLPQIGLLTGLVAGLVISGFQLMGLIRWLEQRAAARIAKPARSGTGKSRDATGATTPSTGDPETEAEDPWDRRWREKWEDDDPQ